MAYSRDILGRKVTRFQHLMQEGNTSCNVGVIHKVCKKIWVDDDATDNLGETR